MQAPAPVKDQPEQAPALLTKLSLHIGVVDLIQLHMLYKPRVTTQVNNNGFSDSESAHTLKRLLSSIRGIRHFSLKQLSQTHFPLMNHTIRREKRSRVKVKLPVSAVMSTKK
jgi:hypothetical protein